MYESMFLLGMFIGASILFMLLALFCAMVLVKKSNVEKEIAEIKLKIEKEKTNRVILKKNE